MDREKLFPRPATVFVIDDDAATRNSIAWLLESADYRVETYESGEGFFEVCRSDWTGCLILDLRLPGISGVALQDKLAKQGITLPVIMLTGYGDVSTAVRAFHQGAVDFIEKPYTDEELLSCIERAMSVDRERRREMAERRALSERLDSLTPREREVMAMVVAGKPNKVVAFDLGISQKTVESHRARLMEKLRVQSLADLVRLAFIAMHVGVARA
jgi:RNA polymerase sigma factor (sigma-70 family)